MWEPHTIGKTLTIPSLLFVRVNRESERGGSQETFKIYNNNTLYKPTYK